MSEIGALGSVLLWAVGSSAAVAGQGSGAVARQAKPLEALTVYAGSWLVSPKAAAGEAAKTDHLTNRCLMAEAFYTCEQVVNGKAMALLVFTAGDTPGSYHSTIVLPDGSPGGRPGELTIVGQQWTYLNKDSAGAPTFRVENTVKDRDHIHYEQYKAVSGGGWEKVGEGDEVRTTSP